jgi:hydroxymethylpyrimidine/phosphomethylpyrimidine kinase
MMPTSRPYALSVAGFDPSGGAGLLADIKTMEACRVYGLGVVSALTWQNDIAFEKVEWMAPEKIFHQLRVLRARFDVRQVKIGLIEDFSVLQWIISSIQEHFPAASIIWDPVLKASAGFSFHDQINHDLLDAVLQRIACITPNLPEAEQLFGADGLHEKLLAQSRHTAVYLKGGHDGDEETVTDTLFLDGHALPFTAIRLAKGEKHGSGCVLSSALAAQLVLGHDMRTACRNAHDYTKRFLASNHTLLGYHSFNHAAHDDNDK